MSLFRTKSPDLLMREAEAPERKMKRALTAFDLTCLGIGAIIGAGIFALAGTAAAGESAHVGESIVKTPVLNFIIAFVAPQRSGVRTTGGRTRRRPFLRRRGDRVRVRGALL